MLGIMRSTLAVVAIAGAIAASGGAEEPLTLLRAIPMPQVQGRIDHLTMDAAAQRLFVAALGNDTVEVLDTRAGAVLRSIGGFHEPQGIGQPLASDVVAVANGGTGDLVLLDRSTFRVLHTVALGGDADNVRFDPPAHRFYVGYGSGAIAAVSEDGVRAGEVRLAGHPESFQLEGKGSRIYVNVPSARHIAVIDRRSMKVETTWPVTTASSNYPMALDEDGHRLFVGCRRPAKVLVYDTASGKETGAFDVVGDTDDMFYDGKRKRLYVSGGDGFIDVLDGRQAGALNRLAHIPTAAGARTSLLVPAEDRLYLAVPRRANQVAEIRVYAVRD
jgi:DNA-binding beta-propeller fold protein YncE